MNICAELDTQGKKMARYVESAYFPVWNRLRLPVAIEYDLSTDGSADDIRGPRVRTLLEQGDNPRHESQQ